MVLLFLLSGEKEYMNDGEREREKCKSTVRDEIEIFSQMFERKHVEEKEDLVKGRGEEKVSKSKCFYSVCRYPVSSSRLFVGSNLNQIRWLIFSSLTVNHVYG